MSLGVREWDLGKMKVKVDGEAPPEEKEDGLYKWKKTKRKGNKEKDGDGKKKAKWSPGYDEYEKTQENTKTSSNSSKSPKTKPVSFGIGKIGKFTWNKEAAKDRKREETSSPSNLRDAVTKATAYANALSKVQERAPTPPLVEDKLKGDQIQQLQAKAAAMRAAKRIEERHRKEKISDSNRYTKKSSISKSKIADNWSSSSSRDSNNKSPIPPRKSVSSFPTRARASPPPPKKRPRPIPVLVSNDKSSMNDVVTIDDDKLEEIKKEVKEDKKEVEEVLEPPPPGTEGIMFDGE